MWQGEGGLSSRGSRLWVLMTERRGWLEQGEESELHRAMPRPGDMRDAVGRAAPK